MPATRHSTTIAIFLCHVLLILGCGYPEVSPKTYECAKALYSVCNQKDVQRLDIVEQLISEGEAEESLRPAESQWLREIVATARSGEWTEAAAEARQILDDQIVEH